MKPNISLLNAVIRITCGLTILSAAAAKYTRKPWCKMHLFCMMMGAMKAASGMLRFCPVTYMFQAGMTNQSDSDHQEK
ncbi:hypothetical protein AXI59_00900 [Bacillus nakamurai]|uniref:Inner membrane protein YgaP-like transmembrane domain-containing protein n=1 Tax=Bacillus nakamurai TaxID=1793963 RepID=A0A150FB65_9BACI|nr:DUF2892 domain-containing protein [Bacillus nakamurai]KXZ17839.1 hypothetical protein AXI59_00900 [Bacillus nakamurai]KXZ22628.1 hypothetical protein AXI58_07560 [Bacillus nakamurai]MCC9022034.1 DUF2892 domain-containing protein [Bacillus nakamurai]MED1226364.1 DUF2892 domain-containing protein [Bacillus nakamurai]